LNALVDYWITGGSGSLGRASRLAPTIFDAPKALSAMHLLGKQASLVQFRVGAPFP
jgi:hypothetical protein